MTMIAMLVLISGGWLMGRAAVLSWRRPERLDSTWVWKRPGDVAPTGPAPARMLERQESATADWSPIAEGMAAERVMLPLDDVEDWLAVRLSEFDHRMMEIGAATRGADGSPRPVGWTVDQELDAFQRGSSGIQAYRDMILQTSREFTPRESMQLEAILAAA
jgi:hypothetical protein